MNKQIELTRLFIKCGRIGKSEEGNSAVGDTTALIEGGLGILMVVGMFFAGRFAAEHQDMLGTPADIFTVVLFIACFASLFLSFMQAVNQLYMSSDLDVVVTMPFSAAQIVAAKLVSVTVAPMCICLGLVVPASIGFFSAASGLPVLFVPALFVGAVIAAEYSSALASTLAIILMRCFKFLRSKNVVTIITSLLMFAFTIGVAVLSQSTNHVSASAAAGAFTTIVAYAKSVSVVFPFIPMIAAACQGDVVQLILAIVVAVVAFAVVMLCARFFYFSAALAMTDAHGSRSQLASGALKKHTGSRKLSKELLRRELLGIIRTPALLTNGILLSIASPLFLVVPVVATVINSGNFSAITPEMLQSLSAMIPPSLMLAAGSIIALVLAAFAVGMSSLSRNIISREGKDFSALRAMPLDMRQLVSVKRNAALCINGISGFLLPSLAFIVLGFLGVIALWASVLLVVVNFAWLVTLVNFCAEFDVKKPNLNWESETAVCKNNVPGIIALFVAFGLAALAFMAISQLQLGGSIDIALAAVAVALPIACAVATELRLRKSARAL